MPPITTTEQSGFIPEIFLSMALGRLKSYLPIVSAITMSEDLDGARFGRASDGFRE